MSDSSTPGDENPQTADSAEGETAPTQQEPDNGSSATGTTDDEDADGSGSGEDFPGSDDPSQISDDQLPEDLRPTDDNPLAKPADEDDDEDSGMNLQEQAGDAGAPA